MGGMRLEKRPISEMPRMDLGPMPCALCGGHIDLIALRTFVDYATDSYFCGCHISENIKAAQDGLAGFVERRD